MPVPDFHGVTCDYAACRLYEQCSGTLIGPKHMLTAGHCAVMMGDTSDSHTHGIQFWPAVNGNEEPFPPINVAETYTSTAYADATTMLDITVSDDFALLLLETTAPPGTAFMAIVPSFGEHYFDLTTAGYPGNTITTQMSCDVITYIWCSVCLSKCEAHSVFTLVNLLLVRQSNEGCIIFYWFYWRLSWLESIFERVQTMYCMCMVLLFSDMNHVNYSDVYHHGLRYVLQSFMYVLKCSAKPELVCLCCRRQTFGDHVDYQLH